MEGIGDGPVVGLDDGAKVADGVSEGLVLPVGNTEGRADGSDVGTGVRDGELESSIDGSTDGIIEGLLLGRTENSNVG